MPPRWRQLAARCPPRPAPAQGTGLTGAPGRIFWKPSTMTCSPGLQAVEHDPVRRPQPRRSCTVRGAVLPSSPTTITRVALRPARHRLLRHQHRAGRSAPAPGACARTCRAAAAPAGWRTSVRSVTWPMSGRPTGRQNSSRPRCGSSLPSSSTTRTALRSARRAPARGGRLAQPRHLGHGLRRVDVHRVDLLDQRQLRGLGLADTSAPSVTSARPMRPEIGAVTRGIAEVELRRLQRGRARRRRRPRPAPAPPAR